MPSMVIPLTAAPSKATPSTTATPRCGCGSFSTQNYADRAAFTLQHHHSEHFDAEHCDPKHGRAQARHCWPAAGLCTETLSVWCSPTLAPTPAPSSLPSPRCDMHSDWLRPDKARNRARRLVVLLPRASVVRRTGWHLVPPTDLGCSPSVSPSASPTDLPTLARSYLPTQLPTPR